MRLVGIIVGSAALFVVSLISPAVAQSSYCLPLQMELAQLSKSTSGSNTNALRRQLNQARAEERNAGCRGLFSRRRLSNQCRSLRSRISSLERQLSGSGWGGLFGQSPLDRRRESVIAALRRNGCSLYSSNYRTVCVRVCDGYYFPLSNTSSRQRFTQDAEKCAGQYGPGESVLFYYPFPNGDVSEAVSLDGERYFDQPYAFIFRSAFVPACAAQLHEGLAALRQRVFAAVPALPLNDQFGPTLGERFEAAVDARVAGPTVPVPIAQPNGSSDPETLANRAGGLVPTPTAPQVAPVNLVGDATRTVGDPYYFAEANPGPPPTVAGYKPPVLKDFRAPLKASILPAKP